MERLYWNMINFNDEKMFFTVTNDGLNFISNPGHGISQVYNFYQDQTFEFKFSSKMTKPYKKQLEEYLQGERRDIGLPIDLSNVSDYRMRRAWQLIQTVKYGNIVSFDQLAKKVLHIENQNILIDIIKNNPILMVIPTHRIITDENISKYFRESKTMKSQLLELETISSMN